MIASVRTCLASCFQLQPSLWRSMLGLLVGLGVVSALAATIFASSPVDAAPSADCINRLPCYDSWILGRKATNSYVSQRTLLRQPVDSNVATACQAVLDNITATGNPAPEDMGGFTVGCEEALGGSGVPQAAAPASPSNPAVTDPKSAAYLRSVHGFVPGDQTQQLTLGCAPAGCSILGLRQSR